jgi:threonine/homoserine/homoserine lactone efflux protein
VFSSYAFHAGEAAVVEVLVVALSAVVAFWGTSFLLVITPGADWAYMINAGLRNRSVLPAAAGLLFGYLALTAVVAAGVAVLIANSPVLLGALTLAGAAYLIWLGVSTVLHPAEPAQAGGGATGASWWRQALKGAGISGLNPKGLILFALLLPLYADASSTWPMPLQVTVFGLVHVLSCAVVYSGVGVGARVVLRARPSLARAVSRFSGAAMVTIGGVLVAHQFAG